MNLDWLAAGFLPLVAVKSLVLLSITWVVAVQLRRHSAAAAHRVWTLGFVGCALLPLITLVHGWTLPGVVVPAEITAAQPLVPELPGEGLTYDDRAEASLPPQVASVPVTREVVASDTDLRATKTPQGLTTWEPEQVMRGIWIVWGGIALLLTLRLIWQHVALWRRVARSSTLIHSDGWTESLTEAASALRLAHVPSIRESTGITSPLCAGLLRPVILLPTGCDEWSPERRRLVLLHELAHVKRRDVFIQALASLVTAAYWFNPLAWVGNAQMRRLREVASDDMVLNSGANSRDYAEVLVDVARSCRRAQCEPAVAMARGSNVEQRVLAILDGSRRRLALSRRGARALAATVVGLVVMVGSAQVGLQADPPETDSDTSPQAERELTPTEGEEPDMNEIGGIEEASERGRRNFEAIESGHLRFRSIRNSGPFQSGLTPERCAELFAKHDVVAGPDQLRGFLAELYDREQLLPRDRERTPWSDMELHFEGSGRGMRIRETRHQGGRNDVHIMDGNLTLIWSDSNSQLSVVDTKANRLGIVRPHEFWRPLQVPTPMPPGGAMIQEGELIRLEDTSSGAFLLTADATTGLVLAMDSIRGNRTSQRRWSAWAESPDGVPYPRLVTDLEFQNDLLHRVTIYVVTEARFNHPLADSVFRLGAPAGSVIVDQRGDKVSSIKINRDVFDASSGDDVRRAAGALSDEVTQTELEAFDVLRKMYVLEGGEFVRHYGEPYHLVRKHLARMIQPHAIPNRRGDSMYCNFLVWRDEAIAQESKIGQSNFVENVIAMIVGHPRVDSQIPEEIGDRQISGDFLYRPDATPEQNADALSKILSRELGQPIRLTFKDVERTFYFARGQVTIDPANFRKFEDRPIIEVNGGDYDGDHGEVIGSGTFANNVDDIAKYIGTQIIDETQPNDTNAAWSYRWYDRTGTPKEQRFKLDPEAVLQKVSDQTGVEFVPKQQTVRMLVVETE